MVFFFLLYRKQHFRKSLVFLFAKSWRFSLTGGVACWCLVIYQYCCFVSYQWCFLPDEHYFSLTSISCDPQHTDRSKWSSSRGIVLVPPQQPLFPRTQHTGQSSASSPDASSHSCRLREVRLCVSQLEPEAGGSSELPGWGKCNRWCAERHWWQPWPNDCSGEGFVRRRRGEMDSVIPAWQGDFPSISISGIPPIPPWSQQRAQARKVIPAGTLMTASILYRMGALRFMFLFTCRKVIFCQYSPTSKHFWRKALPCFF